MTTPISSAAAITNMATPVPASAFTLRPAHERGGGDHGWLKSRFSFSFANYQDPNNVHFQALRVINDDLIAPANGFPMHPHENFEIFSYVVEGQIEHKDSMGNGSVVGAGGIQYMSAGSGVRHSEFNPSQDETLRLLQIWLIPTKMGGAPRYDTLQLSAADKDGKLKLFLSGDGRDGSLKAVTDALIYAATLDGSQVIRHSLKKNQNAWIQMVKGTLTVNGQQLHEGDGLAVEDSGLLTFKGGQNAEFILFDLAPLDA